MDAVLILKCYPAEIVKCYPAEIASILFLQTPAQPPSYKQLVGVNPEPQTMQQRGITSGSTATGNCRPQDRLDEVFRRGKIIEADGVLDTDTRQETVADDDGDESERFDAVEAQTEMDIDWSDITVNTAYLAADLQMMFGGKNDNQNKQKKKTVRERKHGQKKKEDQSQDIDFEIKM